MPIHVIFWTDNLEIICVLNFYFKKYLMNILNIEIFQFKNKRHKAIHACLVYQFSGAQRTFKY